MIQEFPRAVEAAWTRTCRPNARDSGAVDQSQHRRAEEVAEVGRVGLSQTGLIFRVDFGAIRRSLNFPMWPATILTGRVCRPRPRRSTGSSPS